MKIGFIGLGIMGKPMVRNLLKAGHEVWVNNRSKAPMEELAKDGAHAVSRQELAENAEIIITMLPNGPQVKEVMLGDVVNYMHVGQIFIDCSSISPVVSKEIAAVLAEKGVEMLDAPVSGGEPKAIDGTLSFMVGGKQEVFDVCKDILAAMGASVTLCGDVGAGRMSEPAQIVERCVQLLTAARDMQDLRVLVTAGPTCENIDPVRFITNRSSGKMGYALAEAALRRGAQVTLVTGPVSFTPPQGAQVEPVRTTEDLLQRMLALAPEQDIVIQAAAPADYRAQQIAPQKLKKQGDGALTLTFVPTPDVAKAVGEGKHDGQILVGFAAETETAVENARKKLDSKHLDMIVANDVTQPGAGFDVDTNIATIITHQQAESLPIMTKKALADEILTRALALRG